VTAVPARDAAYKLLVEHVHQVALVAVDEPDDGGLVRQRHQLVHFLVGGRCFKEALVFLMGFKYWIQIVIGRYFQKSMFFSVVAAKCLKGFRFRPNTVRTAQSKFTKREKKVSIFLKNFKKTISTV
jgi:hypothetical protein